MAGRLGMQYRRFSEDARLEAPTTFEAAVRNRPHARSLRSQTQTIPPRDLPRSARSPPEKKPIQEPLTVGQFFTNFVLHMCKQYVLFRPGFKAPFYLFLVFMISCLGDLIRPQRKLYLSRPGNIVTVWIVQKGEYWTFILLFLFVGLTSYFYCAGRLKGILRNLFRVGMGLIIRYVTLSSFSFIQSLSAFCSNEDIRGESVCLEAGHRWLSFDISDDTFSLVFLALTMMEEVVCFSRWEELDFALKLDPMDVLISPERSVKNAEFVESRYRSLTGLIQTLFFLLTMLCLVFDVMLVMAAFFYQSLPQKISGALIGTVCWVLTYQFWYPNAWPFLPGLGIIRSLRAKPLRK